jgi:hypothetical protein
VFAIHGFSSGLAKPAVEGADVGHQQIGPLATATSTVGWPKPDVDLVMSQTREAWLVIAGHVVIREPSVGADDVEAREHRLLFAAMLL